MNEIDYQLLERYLAGEASPTEEVWLRAWLAADPARAAQVERFKEVWLNARSDPSRYDANEGWLELKQKLEPAAKASVHVLPRSFRALPTRSRHRALGVIAATLIVAAGGGLLTEAIHQRMLRGAVETAAMREITTARGQRVDVRLADGSQVLLGPQSRLITPDRFGRGTRSVTLEGEAFFDVPHDERRPFVVRTGAAVTRVLGTSFGLRAYPSDSVVQLAVKTGRVQFAAATLVDSRTILAAGAVGRLDRHGRVLVDPRADVDAQLAWMRDRLVFRDAHLHDVAAELERWYDVDIDILDREIADFPLTADIERQPLEEALMVISRTLDIQYSRSGSTVQFRAASRTDGNPASPQFD